jgi:Kef-type K+ transport system membrane component KefB
MDPTTQFAVVVTIALAVVLAARRIHLPGIVGLLVAGMVIGPGGADILPREPVVELLGSVGLLYLMFLAGAEVDLDILRSHRRETLAFGLLAFSLSMIPALTAGLLLGLGVWGALLLGSLLSSHTLVAYSVIQQYGLLHHRPIVIAIGGTLVTDTLALALLAIVLSSSGAAGGGTPFSALTPLLGLVALSAASLWLIPRISKALFAEGVARRTERALYVLVVVLVLAIAADLLGTEKILGAFVAGVSLNRALGLREILREHVEFIGETLFIPFFFVSTGMLLELDVLVGRLDTWLLAGLLIGIVLAGKTSSAWIAGAVYGYSRWGRVAVSGLTVPQAAATLAVTVLAREAGLFPEIVVDAVIILILVTCLVGILVTRRAARALARARAEPGGA